MADEKQPLVRFDLSGLTLEHENPMNKQARHRRAKPDFMCNCGHTHRSHITKCSENQVGTRCSYCNCIKFDLKVKEAKSGTARSPEGK